MFKKIFKGALVLVGALVVAGIIINEIYIACWNASVEEYNKEIQQEEQVQKDYKEKAQTIVDEMFLEIYVDEYESYLVGNFTNTTDKEITYLEINYKFINKDGVTVDSSFINEINIAPNETREIKIDTWLANEAGGYETIELKVNYADIEQ